MDTPQDFPRGLLIAALLVCVVWGLVAAKAFLVPLCLAALLAFLMNPLVRILCRRGLPDSVSVTLSAFLLFLPLLAFLSLVVVEIQALVTDFPRFTGGLNHELANLAQAPWARRLHVPSNLSQLSQRVSQEAGQSISTVLVALRTFLETGTELVLVLIFAVVMLASRRHLRSSGEKILARFEDLESARMLDEVTRLIEKFLIGRLIIVGVIAVASALLLRAFGIAYGFLLGTFVGVMTLVPEVGFVISLVPVVAVCLATGHSVGSLVLLLVALTVVHTAEGYLLTPRLVGRQVNINALTTFLGLFAGGLMWGVWGMFLSVPILGVLRIAFSAAPNLQPWGELLAERDDRRLARHLLRRRREAA